MGEKKFEDIFFRVLGMKVCRIFFRKFLGNIYFYWKCYFLKFLELDLWNMYKWFSYIRVIFEIGLRRVIKIVSLF